MNIKELTRQQSKEAMDEWIANYPKLPDVSQYWLAIRRDLQNYYESLKQETGASSDNYQLDIHMGLYLYEYFSHEGFTMRMASNVGLWRYVSLKVVPDLVGDRWGYNSSDHFWAKPARIWLRSLWWYVYLSWQGDINKTETVLSSPNFNTDTIINLEERTGRNGTYVDVYRYIMYYYSIIPADRVRQINGRMRAADKHATLFRTIMKLNTARTLVVEPSLYLGGSMEYVKSLYKESGVEF